MSKDTGGPAFPYKGTTGIYGVMTLRDYFAAKALSGLLANALVNRNGMDSVIASFQIADAMIAERNK